MMRWPPLLAILLIAGCNAPADRPPADETKAACGLEGSDLGGFVTVPAGQFRKGAYAVYPEEAPEMILHVGAFEMLAHEVTNEEFSRFVDATGYQTLAERSAEAGGVGAGSAVFGMPGEHANAAEV